MAYHIPSISTHGTYPMGVQWESLLRKRQGKVLCRGCGVFYLEGNPMRTHVQNSKDSRCFSALAQTNRNRKDGKSRYGKGRKCHQSGTQIGIALGFAYLETLPECCLILHWFWTIGPLLSCMLGIKNGPILWCAWWSIMPRLCAYCHHCSIMLLCCIHSVLNVPPLDPHHPLSSEYHKYSRYK